MSFGEFLFGTAVTIVILFLIAVGVASCSVTPTEYVIHELRTALVAEVSFQPEHTRMEGKVAYTVPDRWKTVLYQDGTTYTIYSMDKPTYAASQQVSLRRIGLGYRGASQQIYVPVPLR